MTRARRDPLAGGSGEAGSAQAAEGGQSEKSQKAVAFHEAGHVVACYLMRRRFSYVTIDPSEDWLGSVCGHKVSKCFRPDVDGWGGTRSVAERILMVLVAGDVAESRLERRQSRPGSSDDLVKAFELASRICGSDEEVEAYLNWLYIRIGCLLEIEYHWKAVEAVAAALLTRKRIGYRKARSIVKNAIET